jgi:hypothetical protein
MVEKIWRKEVWRAKYEFGDILGGIFGNIECWEGFRVKIYRLKCNLEKDQGSRCKMEAKICFPFKTRARTENMWSSGVFSEKWHDFSKNSELFLFWKFPSTGSVARGLWVASVHHGFCGHRAPWPHRSLAVKAFPAIGCRREATGRWRASRGCSRVAASGSGGAKVTG